MAIWWSGRWSQIQIGPTTTWQNGVAQMCRTLSDAPIGLNARVETLGELDSALEAARESKSGAYIEVIGGRMDMPKGLAFAHTRLKELYGDAA
jgi:hypothetical protein